MQQIHYESVDSTNNQLKRLLKEKEIQDFTYITAFQQMTGRGQLGNHWESNPGENITLSILVKIKERLQQTPFDLNIIASLAIHRLLVKQIGLENVAIKWPNDILIEGRKVAGILVENDWCGKEWQHAIIGIGLNVWQEKFSTYTPPATSLANELARTTRQNRLPKEYQEWHHHYCHLLVQECKTLIQTADPDDNWYQYHKHLYNIGVPTRFKTKKGEIFTGIIQKVNLHGQIEIQNQITQNIQAYAFKEVAPLYNE